MTDKQAIDLLRARGYVVGDPDAHSGEISVWTPGGAYALKVRVGKELGEFAAGKLTWNEVAQRREDEIVLER